MNRVLFVHGWGLESGIAKPVFEAMKTPIHVSGVDLPGYGGEPPVDEYSLDNMVKHVMAAVDEPVTLVGWSMGGLIAAWATIQNPQMVERLILINATPCFVEKKRWPCGMHQKIFQQFLQSAQNDLAATHERFLSLQFPTGADTVDGLRQLRAYRKTAVPPDTDALYNGLGLLATADIRYRLLEISCPTLILHGTGDRLVPDCAAREIQTEIEGSVLQYIEHGGHAPFLTRPARTAELMDGFFAS